MDGGDADSRDQNAHGGDATQCVEWCPICRTMDVLRATATPEAREQWEEVQREAVITLRALVDEFASRIDERRPEPDPDPPHPPQRPVQATPVEEIPPVE